MQVKDLRLKRALRSALLVLLLSAVGMGKMYAYDFSAVCETGQTLYYNITDAENHYVELTCPGWANYEYCWYGYTKPTGEIILPESVQYEDVTYTLTSIGCYTFYNCSELIGNLNIPNSVTLIGGHAFTGCSGFTGSLTIPNTITIIGEFAFYYCSGFSGSLTIGNLVTTIGENAFDGCNGFTGNLTIGNSVTIIDNGAFESCRGFTGSLTIPNSVISIGRGAFRSCTGFTGNLTIPNSVTTIGNYAFDNCSGFTGNLTIGSSVTTIGEGAFSSCSGFTGSLTIPNSVTTIGGQAFRGCSGFTDGLTIGNSVTEIGWKAFDGCNGFYYITNFAETLPIWGDNAFSWSSNIPVYVPCGFEEVYSSLSWGDFSIFYGMCGGTVITEASPEGGGIVMGGGSFEAGQTCTVNATANEGYAFAKWTRNGTIVSMNYEYTFYVAGNMELIAHFVPEGNIVFADDNVKSICVSHWDTNGDGELSYSEAAAVTALGQVFSENNEITSFEELQFFIGLTTISNYAFYNCSGLTSIIIPSSVNLIGESAFSGCSGFSGSLTIPNSVTTIGNSAFGYCSGFTGSLTIPNSVTFIDNYAFRYCSGFTGSLIIPNSLTSISDGAFYSCSGFSGDLIVPNSVTYIGRYAFCYCSGFKGNLIIPDSVTTIGNYAFYGCSGFTGSLSIGNSVTTIGGSAFNGCSGFTGSLSIGNSVTTIGGSAFYNCSGLTEAMMLRTIPPTLGIYVFSYMNFPIYVPYESLNVYKTATNWNEYEDRIFPMAYTTISGYGEGDGNYRFIASPLLENTDPTAVDNMITETPYDLYRFDQSEDAEWQNYKFPENTPNFFLTNGQGYLYANAEDVNLIFKGEFNEDETKEVELAYDADADFAGWNLVGNPFPVSAYANKSYYTMNEDGTAVEPNMVSSATAIPACTGVMVKAEAQGETIVFNTTTPETASNKGCVQIALSQVVDRGGVSTSSTTLQDKAIVSFNAGDRLEKFVFNKDNAKISIPQGGKDLAIACAEKQGELPLNFKAVKNGTYTLSVDVKNADVDYLHLIDNLTGADIDLLQMPDYVFTAKMTDYASRFCLVFNANEMDGPSTGSGTFAFINNGNIIVTDAEAGAMLQMVDVTGRIIVCRDAARHVSTSGMTPGVYVLRLIHSNDVKTQRIVID